MKLTEMFPSNLLKAQDVTDAGGEMELTIFNVEIKDFDGDNGVKERKPIVVFAEGDKRMVLNKTNANRLSEMFGDDTDNWLNKKIILHVEQTDFQGKTVPSVRVKVLGGKQAAVDSYWTKVREMGLTRQEGLDHLKEFGGDFPAALGGLESKF